MRGARPVKLSVLGAASALALFAPVMVAQTPEEQANAKTWIGKAAEYEEYLRTAEVVKMEDIGVGVTHPHRAYLKPGGPFESMAWKPIKPGRYEGFQESYKSEIAAYEIDKLLELNMVPPTVERTIKGETGAAIMWCSPTKNFKEMGSKGGVPPAPPRYAATWSHQISRAKLFDNLIGNVDPNLGNWLTDPGWDLILIDHTRALTSTKDMPHKLMTVDAALWDRMKALDEAKLTAAVGKWLDKGEIKAILERRDKIAQDIDKLVKSTPGGADAVFFK